MTQVLMVLSDGATFGSAEGSYILLAPGEKKLTAKEWDEFQDGRVPDTQDDWPDIAFGWDTNGDFVAQVNVPEGGRTVVLLTAAQLKALA